ncbi:vWA domain-containing protein [Halomonas faecis]|uniref:vWA domain-containing protein n=1 Tax=Halomonas faecis TaxID=1562110 RepID=UPI0013D25FFC|nr:VWA domain-containing protein [Halomonas faecis]
MLPSVPRSVLRRSLVTLISSLLLLAASSALAERVSVLILDASGSMWNRIEGDVTRIEVARDVIEEYFHDRDQEVPLSVLAYGHNRRGDCGDIEIVAAMGRHDTESLASQLRALNPQGMTPIADSLVQASAEIPRSAEAADIILVTDGLETCDGDPCQVASDLAAAGLDLRAHVVGFGLSQEEVQNLSCITEQTSGQLFQTNSGAELASALSEVEAVASAPAETRPEPEPEPQPDAHVSTAEETPAGSEFDVEWEGPDDDRDYITIVEAGAPEGSYLDYTRTQRGSPLSLIAPDALGEYEVRYVHQQSEATLASQPVTLTPVEASLSAPDEAPAGSVIDVEWEGPDNPRDYLTIVEAGAPEGSHLDYTRTQRGSPLSLTAPDALGNYEIRYVIQQSGRTLASEPITLTSVEASLSAPDETPAGSVIDVEWEGPDNPRDYLTIVEAGAPEGSHLDYTRTQRGSPLSLTAPDALGNYEIRYVIQQSGRTLASRPITLTPITATLEVGDPIVPGGDFQVHWEGPNNPRDYITIVEAGAEEGSHTDYVRTQRGSPVTLEAPQEPGDYEIRYVVQQSGRTLASAPVTVATGDVSLSIEGSPETGGVVTVNWQGPGRYEDLIQIVEADSPDDAPAIHEARASQGSPLQLYAPASSGEYELRYKASDSGEVLASVPLTLE